nr:hypothetical protein [Sphingomonas yabuuchiae]
MILLHPKVGLGDQMVAQFGVIFADNRIECDLSIFGYTHVPELAVVGPLRTGDKLLDRKSDHVRRAAILACGYRIDLVAQIPRDPDRAVCFGT